MHTPDRPCAGRPVGPVRAALGGAAALGSEPARAHARWAPALFRLGCALLRQAGRALNRVLRDERAVDGLLAGNDQRASRSMQCRVWWSTEQHANVIKM